MRTVTLSRGAAVLAACAALAACKGKDNAGADTAAARDTLGARRDTLSSARTDTGTATTSTSLADPNIVAILDEANAADSAAGAIAVRKGTNRDVVDFGRTMMRDHHQLRKQGQDLAKQLNVTPQPPANDSLPAKAQQAAARLNATPKGMAFDTAYINGEVAMHQQVLQTAQQAQTAAQNQQLKDLITKAAPLIQQHLTRAQGVQQRLSSGGSAAAKSDTSARTKAPGKAPTKTPAKSPSE